MGSTTTMTGVLGAILSTDGLVFLVGIVCVYIGAELLVSGAASLAIGYGIRPATVGVTIVAFATTAPELFVSSMGAISASDKIALGNIVGSNIANIGLVLGASAVVSPISIDRDALSTQGPFMLAAAVALVVLSADGTLATFDGAFLLAILALFSLHLYSDSQDRDQEEVIGDEVDETVVSTSTIGRDDVLKTVGALVFLLVGSRSLILGGRGILLDLGFGELFIGLTIIAFGTSVPELATSLVSAYRGQADFSVTNVIGSNIYNILAVIGIVALIVPIGVSGRTMVVEFPIMILFTLVALGMMRYGDGIGRPKGTVLLVGYLAFFYVLFVARSDGVSLSGTASMLIP